MKNADEVLDILEEKLTKALHKLRMADYDNTQLQLEVLKLKDIAENYEEYRRENILLKERLEKLSKEEHKIEKLEREKMELVSRINDLEKIEIEYYKMERKNNSLIALVREEKENKERYMAKVEVLEEEAKKLRHVKDSVRHRVAQLISKLESDESLTGYTSEDVNEYDKVDGYHNEHISYDEKSIKYVEDKENDIKSEIEFYKDSSDPIKRNKDNNTSGKDNDINFFLDDNNDDNNDGSNDSNGNSENLNNDNKYTVDNDVTNQK